MSYTAKLGPVTGSISTSPNKYGGISANISIGGSGHGKPQEEQAVVETETMTFSSGKPVETSTVGLGKPTTTSTFTSPSRQQTIIATGGDDGGVKSVTASLLQQYDKRNTGTLEGPQIGDLLKDVYKILGESFFPKPEDIEGMTRVLDINKDGRVTSDDLEAVCQKFLGKKGGFSSAPVVRRGGEQEKRSAMREDDDEKPVPPEVEFARQIGDARKIFERFDTDKSGFLEEDEIPKVLQETYEKIGMKKTIDARQVKSYISALDHNKDGKVSMDEFIKVLIDNLVRDKAKFTPRGMSYKEGGYQKAVVKTEMEKAREIFDRHDVDKSGFLEPNEVPSVLQEMISPNRQRVITIDDVKIYMKSFDKNLDHKISFEEFSRLVDVAKKAHPGK